MLVQKARFVRTGPSVFLRVVSERERARRHPHASSGGDFVEKIDARGHRGRVAAPLGARMTASGRIEIVIGEFANGLTDARLRKSWWGVGEHLNCLRAIHAG